MSGIADVSAAGPERAEEALGDQSAIGLAPAHGVVVAEEVVRGGFGFGGCAAGTVFLEIRFEHGGTESARAAVDEQREFVAVETERGEGVRIEDFFHALQFGEVIAAAERAEGFDELRGAEFLALEAFAGVAFPGMLEVEGQFAPAIELGLAPKQVRGEERHAAADVAADEVRVDDALGDIGGADGHALAGMQVGVADGAAHAGELRGGVELAQGFAFNPVLRRGDESDVGFGECGHGFLSSVVSVKARCIRRPRAAARRGWRHGRVNHAVGPWAWFRERLPQCADDHG